jgi:hypothetical protein
MEPTLQDGLMLLLLVLLDLMDGSPDQTLILATSLFRELL